MNRAGNLEPDKEFELNTIGTANFHGWEVPYNTTPSGDTYMVQIEFFVPEDFVHTDATSVNVTVLTELPELNPVQEDGIASLRLQTIFVPHGNTIYRDSSLSTSFSQLDTTTQVSTPSALFQWNVYTISYHLAPASLTIRPNDWALLNLSRQSIVAGMSVYPNFIYITAVEFRYKNTLD